jgi:ABC-type multidrug transport system permease subunit
MNNSFINLLVLQLKEFYREPEVLFWAVLFPLALSAVLGFAFSQQGVIKSKVAIVENAYTSAHAGIARLQNQPFDSVGKRQIDLLVAPRDKAFLQLKRGEVNLVLEPAENNRFVYHFDPVNEEAYLQYLSLEKKLQLPAPSPSTVRAVSTPGSRYIDFLIPGMIAFGLMNSCIWGIGWNLIELRIKKLLRRMIATPMSKAEFLLAQFTTRLLITLFENILLVLLAYLLFDFRIYGNLASVLLLFIAGNIAFGGIAILVAARPEKNQVGSGIINFVTLAMTILSGVFFSYTNFPEWAVNIIRYIPLTLLADSLRSVLNEGATIMEIAIPISLLLGYGALSFVVGLRVFKWY